MVQSSLSSYYMNYNGSKFCVSVKLRAFFIAQKNHMNLIMWFKTGPQGFEP